MLAATIAQSITRALEAAADSDDEQDEASA